ncbi:hypothetical protein JXO52_02190 [bacterium]|nr:hypothetical protein [bacterium]
MKRITIMSAVLLLLALAVSYAHAPAKIDLTFDAETHLLSVAFMHAVRNPADHFIDRVVISLNGEEIITQRANLQESEKGGAFVYKIFQAKPGDTLEVTLECVKGGKMKKTLEIKE